MYYQYLEKMRKHAFYPSPVSKNVRVRRFVRRTDMSS